MARAARRRLRSRRSEKSKTKSQLPFTTHNYFIFGFGIVVLVFGYIFMSIGPVDSFWSLTLAPIVLVIGYVVIIPLSFLYHHKAIKQQNHVNDQQQQPNPESANR